MSKIDAIKDAKPITPLVKWAGGKRRLAKYICDQIDFKYNKYYEPFLGGGAVLFFLHPENAICSDVNEELMNFYAVVKKSPLKLYKYLHDEIVPKHMDEGEKCYMEIRSWDREEGFSQRNDLERAARFLYLNKTCFNGLWRVNQDGYFNVPYGHHKIPPIPSYENIKKVSDYLKHSHVDLRCCDYKECVKGAQGGDLVYFDPPYDVEIGQAGFVSYSKGGFNRDNQEELRDLCDELIERGVTVIVSNSDTSYIKNLYGDHGRYKFYRDLNIIWSVGANGASRRKANEILIIGKRND